MPTHDNRTYRCHKDCISSYTSKHHLKRLAAESIIDHSNPSIQPKKLRSQTKEFNFKEQCMFCEEVCKMEDSRHPYPKKNPVAKVSNNCTQNHSFKDTVLQICEDRNDDWSNKVKFRILSLVSDLNAASAQYHKLCYLKFKTLTKENHKNDGKNQEAFGKICQGLSDKKNKFWSSAEVEEMYKSFGGTVMSRKSLVRNIVQYFKGDIIVLSSPGLSNVLVFKEEAAKHMKMVTNDCEGSEDSTLKAIAKMIKEESMSLKHDHKSYKTGIDRDKAMNDCSPTLLRLLTFICEKFDSKLKLPQSETSSQLWLTISQQQCK